MVAPHVLHLGHLSAREDALELEVKTGRIPAFWYDEDALGVEDPAPEAEEACRKLAEEFHFRYLGFEPCEKGWGSFRFGVI